MSDARLRFYDLLPPAKRQLQVDLIGVGGIGSWAALALARTGIGPVFLYDPDKVEEVNTGTQAHTRIGQAKVDSILAETGGLGEQLAPVPALYVGDESRPDVLCLTVDSMAARASIMRHFARRCPNSWVIDCRMGAQAILLTTGRAKYWLAGYDDDWGSPPACTAKATVPVGMMAGAMVAQAVVDFALNRHVTGLVSANFDSIGWFLNTEWEQTTLTAGDKDK